MAGNRYESIRDRQIRIAEGEDENKFRWDNAKEMHHAPNGALDKAVNMYNRVDAHAAKKLGRQPAPLKLNPKKPR